MVEMKKYNCFLCYMLLELESLAEVIKCQSIIVVKALFRCHATYFYMYQVSASWHFWGKVPESVSWYISQISYPRLCFVLL